MSLTVLRDRYRRGYLATPFRLYKHGPDAAAQEAARLAGELALEGVRVYSPIVYGHALWIACPDIDPNDNEFWLEYNESEMEDCDYILIAEMEGWQNSSGIYGEREFFESCGRPIFHIDPKTLEVR